MPSAVTPADRLARAVTVLAVVAAPLAAGCATTQSAPGRGTGVTDDQIDQMLVRNPREFFGG